MTEKEFINSEMGNESDNCSSLISKKYRCECIDCIGEWEGDYRSIEEIERDIKKFCRSGIAKYDIVKPQD